MMSDDDELMLWLGADLVDRVKEVLEFAFLHVMQYLLWLFKALPRWQWCWIADKWWMGDKSCQNTWPQQVENKDQNTIHEANSLYTMTTTWLDNNYKSLPAHRCTTIIQIYSQIPFLSLIGSATQKYHTEGCQMRWTPLVTHWSPYRSSDIGSTDKVVMWSGTLTNRSERCCHIAALQHALPWPPRGLLSSFSLHMCRKLHTCADGPIDLTWDLNAHSCTQCWPSQY